MAFLSVFSTGFINFIFSYVPPGGDGSRMITDLVKKNLPKKFASFFPACIRLKKQDADTEKDIGHPDYPFPCDGILRLISRSFGSGFLSFGEKVDCRFCYTGVLYGRPVMNRFCQKLLS